MVDAGQREKSSAARPSWPLALAAAALGILIAFVLIPSFHPTNDDPYIQQILAGGVSSEPTANIFFVNYALCWIISRLFVLAPEVPWWSLFQLAVLFLAAALFGRTVLVLVRSRWRSLPIGQEAAVLALLDAGLFGVLVSRLQFTTTSSLLVAVAIISTCCWRDDERDLRGGMFTRLVLPITLGSVGFAIREQSGYLGLFFWGLAALACYAGAKGGWKSRLGLARAALAPLAGTLVVVAALAGIHAAAYASPEWAAQREVASQLARFTDYPRTPYEENPSLYDSVGWDADLLDMAGDWFFLDERINADSLRAINEANHKNIENLMSNPIGTLKSRLLDLGQQTPLAYVALAICVGLLALRCSPDTISRLFVWVAVGAMLAFLAYLTIRGRLPERAIYSVTIPGTMMLASLALRGANDAKTSAGKTSLFVFAFLAAVTGLVLGALGGGTGKLACGLAVVACAAVCVEALSPRAHMRFGAKATCGLALAILLVFPLAAASRQYGWLSDDYALMSDRQETTEAFYDYVEAREDTLFIYSADTSLTSQDPWQMRWPKNQTAWGGWRYSYAWFDEALKEAGFGGRPTSEDLLSDNVRFVSGSRETDETMLRYMNDTFGSVEMRLVETLSDGVFIYQFERVE